MATCGPWPLPSRCGSRCRSCSALETFGELARAVDQYRLALDVLHRDPPTAVGSLRRREAILYGNLADVLHQLGDLSAADDYGRQGLDRATDTDGTPTLFGPSVVLAEIALERGDPAEAIAFAEPARAAADRFGDRLKQCEAEIVLARAHGAAGDRRRAEALLGAALDRAEEYGLPEQTAEALLWLGQVIGRDEPERAQLLVERATAIGHRAGFTLPVVAS